MPERSSYSRRPLSFPRRRESSRLSFTLRLRVNQNPYYGWVFTSYGIAGVVGIAAGNTAKTITGSYNAAFTAAAILCLISAGLAIVLHQTTKRA